jgi:hypothetical protein
MLYQTMRNKRKLYPKLLLNSENFPIVTCEIGGACESSLIRCRGSDRD